MGRVEKGSAGSPNSFHSAAPHPRNLDGKLRRKLVQRGRSSSSKSMEPGGPAKRATGAVDRRRVVAMAARGGAGEKVRLAQQSTCSMAVCGGPAEVAGLLFQGLQFDLLSVQTCSISYILNVHFKSGEWNTGPRCGSVITCVLDGRSLYARVNRFLFVDGSSCPGYASVSWFSVPTYPSHTPLIVSVTEDGADLHRQYGCILRITQIEPCRVMIELPDDTSTVYYMMRDSGYDTI